MSIIWAFQNSDTITKQNWDTHVIWILIWFYLFPVLALLMLLFPTPSSLCSYFPMNELVGRALVASTNPNPNLLLTSLAALELLLWVWSQLLRAVLLILLPHREPWQMALATLWLSLCVLRMLPSFAGCVLIPSSPPGEPSRMLGHLPSSGNQKCWSSDLSPHPVLRFQR